MFITWVDEEDRVEGIDYPNGWCAGTTAIHLACQGEAKEIYMLGFDLSSYKNKLNNMYKGTANYLPASAKGFNPVNWIDQLNQVFNKYSDKTFHWVDCKLKGKWPQNVRYLTKNRFRDILSVHPEAYTKEERSCKLRGWQ